MTEISTYKPRRYRDVDMQSNKEIRGIQNAGVCRSITEAAGEADMSV